MSFRFHPLRQQGSALVITLLVIVVLAIIVTAFLQSMSIEHQTSRSYLNRYQAELAADAAQSAATTQIRQLLTANPYHGVGYLPDSPTLPITVDSATPLYTVIYGAPAATATAAPTPKPYYLVSGTDSNFTTIPKNLNDDNSIPVNQKKDKTDTVGWMGSPVDANGNVTYRECRAAWVYILQDPSKKHQPDQNAGGYNPYIARYAYWVEDETSKIDLLRAGNSLGSGGAFQPTQPADLINGSSTGYLDGVAWRPSDLDLGAIPIDKGKPIDSSDSGTNQSLINFLHPLVAQPPDAQVLGLDENLPDSEPKARFYTTVSSISNELSGIGRRRININALVHDVSSDPKIISSDIDDIAYAITGEHIITDKTLRSGGIFDSVDNNNASAPLPQFGDRFWPASDGDVAALSVPLASGITKRQIYLTKLAANIRDYIDSDSNPTFVDENDHVIAGSNSPISKDNDPPPGVFPNYDGTVQDFPMPIAVGKENLPYMVKSGTVMTFIKGSNQGSLGVDQYFSFYNPYTKDFHATSGTYLRCFNRLWWHRLSDFQMPSFWLDLSNLTIPAGQVRVITTSVGTNSAGAKTDPGISDTDIKPVPESFFWRSGSVGGSPSLMHPPTACIHTESGPTFFYVPRSDEGYDTGTKIVWGNADGYLGGFPAVTVTAFTKTNYSMGTPGTNVKTYSERGNSIQGNNNDSSTSGDPRALEEPLVFNHNNGSASVLGQHRFFDDAPETLSDPNTPTYVLPPNWPDYTATLTNSSTTSYAVVRDEPMTSIGELGNIYDPYRIKGSIQTIGWARGGGRTLRVGQPDDTIEKPTESGAPLALIFKSVLTKAAKEPRFDQLWNQSAWRLTDIFDVILKSTNTVPSQITVDRTVKLVPPQANGKLNINSVLRDGGAAFRTLLRGFTYVGSQALTDSDITAIITSLQSYLKTNGPVIERGELSQLLSAASSPLFNADSSSIAGQVMSKTSDRVREEIFRRLVEMLTTRSDSFTVYAVGQAIHEKANGELVPVSTINKGTTYRFDPTISGKTGVDIPDSDPAAVVSDFTPVSLYDHPY